MDDVIYILEYLAIQAQLLAADLRQRNQTPLTTTELVQELSLRLSHATGVGRGNKESGLPRPSPATLVHVVEVRVR